VNTQLLYIQQLVVYYKLTLTTTLWLRKPDPVTFSNDSNNPFIQTQAAKQLLIEVWSGLQQTIVDEAINVSTPVPE